MKTKSHLAVDCFTFLLCIWLANLASATSYTLTLVAQGSGTVERNPTNADYPAGVVVTITANPSAGWYFANWSGGTNSTANPLNVMMNADLVITGNFLAYPTYSVAVVTNGQGTIALNPPGGGYFSNTVVTATAMPAIGWVFAGWSGATSSSANPVSFAVNTNGTLIATFAELPAFDVQPMSVTNQAGSSVSFSAHAVGTGPLGYQWYFSGALPMVANSSSLSLTNVGTGQEGNYWVVAANNFGSATSQVAALILTNSAGPTNLVYAPNEGSLLAAIAVGGWVGLQYNGTLTLTNTLNITNDVVLDGSRFGATISGGLAVQLFYVASGASLTVSNLTLANGLATNDPADGGAIYNNGGTVVLVGCTLSNNAAQSLVGGGLARGGAIFNNGGTVTLNQSALASNSVIGGFTGGDSGTSQGFGGTLYNTNGATTIIGCTVIDNSSEALCDEMGFGLTMGGAIFQASGAMNITNSNFLLNQAVGGAGGGGFPADFPASPAYGGALAVTGGSLSVDHDQFVTNQAIGGSGSGVAGGASGGAVYCTAGWTANDSTFSGNQALAGSGGETPGATGCGGGIFNGGTLTLNRCSLYVNEVQGGTGYGYGNIVGGEGLGGGIFNAAELAATNCTIALNSAVGAPSFHSNFGNSATSGNAIGGGVYNDSSATFIAMNLTIASNNCSSPVGAESSNGFTAGLQIANNNGGTLSVHNTLIAYSGTNSNAYGSITDDGYNICSDGSAALDSGSSYNYTDPELAPLGNYGGPTWSMALLATSPAIDSGDPADFPPTDQRGYLRPFGAGPDIGAYEYGSAISDVPYLNLSVTGGNVMLSFSVFLTNTYYLQSSTNLVTWVNVSTTGPFAGGTYVSQPVSKQGLNRCFFRLLLN